MLWRLRTLTGNVLGHTSGVYSFSFSADSSKVATVSKDGTWKVFNTAIEYLKGQDANIIVSGDYSKELDSSRKSQITISPDGRMVAISQDRLVNLYSVLTGKLLASIEEPHSQSVTKVTPTASVIINSFPCVFRSCSLLIASIYSRQETNISEFSTMSRA